MADPCSASIITPLVFALAAGDGITLPVPAELAYDASEPLSVRITFWADAAGPVVWVFARDLLADGVWMPAGQGDIGIWPAVSDTKDAVCIALSSPDGSALLECDRGELAKFVSRAYAAVPREDETAYLDVDAAIDALLGH